MKAAAAVLGASLLFFLGVLTGAGGRQSMPPPGAIPLGAAGPTASPVATEPDAGQGLSPSTTTTATGTHPAATATANTTASTASARPTGPNTPTTVAPPTSTTTAGQVEQVDNQVNCGRGNGKGRGQACASTTTSSREGPGGRNR